MCGIWGIYHRKQNRLANEQFVLDCTNTMIHRGPDDYGIFIDRFVGLGHRRLSIIDLSTGKQPMFNEDCSIAIVFNGEIYNYLELHDILTSKGHIFKTRSDTETIIHAYEEWGEQCVERFRGMFAFAVWNKNKNEMFIARDRVGIKPLYYVQSDDIFIFSSEIKAILKTEIVKREVDLHALDSYLTIGYVPGEKTIFKNIFKLLPGHTIRVQDNKIISHKYWDLNFTSENTKSLKVVKNEFLELFTDCVNQHLMSDVPLGVFLSGGLDSSAVVAAMDRIVNTSIKTFSIGYENANDISELDYAKMIADKFETEHHIFILEPDNFFSSIELLLHHTEEPIVEYSAIALFHIAKLCRKYATVVLSGEGSDEAFAGYNIYSVMTRLHKINSFAPFIRNIFQLFPTNIIRQEKYKKYKEWATLPIEASYKGTSADISEKIKKIIYTPEFYENRGDYLSDTFNTHFSSAKKFDTLSKLLYVDTKTWLVDDLLLKADKMTMGASIELRVPFLDHKFLEFAANLPSHFKIHNGHGKYVVKKSMENLLPQNIIYRKKMGFPVPINQWFSDLLHKKARDILLEKRCLQRGYINRKYIEDILNQQINRQANHGRRIFSLLNLEMWHRFYIDN